MSKHTEGPWKAHFPEEIGKPIQIELGDIESGIGYQSHHLIDYAECFVRYSGQQKEEAKANAQLIAAAPEMIEVMKEISKLSEPIPKENYLYSKVPNHVLYKMCEVIKRAEGKANMIDQLREEVDIDAS